MRWEYFLATCLKCIPAQAVLLQPIAGLPSSIWEWFQCQGFRGKETAAGLKSWERCHNRQLDRFRRKPQQLRTAVLHCLLAGKCVPQRHTPWEAVKDWTLLSFGWQLTHVPQVFCSPWWHFHTMSLFSYLDHQIQKSQPRLTSASCDMWTCFIISVTLHVWASTLESCEQEF